MLNDGGTFFADQQSSHSSTYINYPANRPFINTNWVRPSYVTSKAFPESNRDLIITALKNLQNKIKILESNADNHKLNKPETNIYSAYPINTDNQDKNYSSFNHKMVMADEEILSSNTEKRIFELEKQLAKMKSILNKSDNTEENKYQEHEYIPKHKSIKKLAKTNKKKKSINEPTESTKKIYPTFSKLDPSKRSAILRSKSLELLQANHNHPNPNLKSSQNHYRLNFGDIPFVVGKSTTPSHHLGSNIQNVISLLKMHHPKICGQVGHSHESSNRPLVKSQNKLIKSESFNNNFNDEQYEEYENKTSKRSKKKNQINQTPTSSSSSSDFSYMNPLKWDEMLRILQEDYTNLVLQHYDLTKQMLNTSDTSFKKELEIEAGELNKRMKRKAKQINKLKAYHQIKVNNNNAEMNEEFSLNQNENNFKIRKFKHHGVTASYDNFNGHQTQSQPNLGCRSSNSNVYVPKSHLKTLKLFKDIKNLQSRLQNDD